MRRRIMLLVTTMTALVVLAFAIPLALLIRRAVYERAVDSLQDKVTRAALYLGQAQLNQSLTDAQIETYLSSFQGVCVSYIGSSGVTLGCAPPGGYQSGTTPGSSYGGGMPGLDGSGGSGGNYGGGTPRSAQRYRGGQLAHEVVRSRYGPGGGQGAVWMYETDAQLHQGENSWWLLLGLSSVGLIAVGAGAGELLTRRLVRPLTQTAETAHRISSGDITARAPEDGPAEIAQVGSALNRLADRIDQLIADERETVADLSHRLRTPMTVLRLDAEGLRNPDEADRMGEHIAAMERTLTSVIRTARRPQREGRIAACDARAVLAERVEFWTPLAEDQGRLMSVDLPAAEVTVRCSAEDLGAAVDALLENVMAHTDEGVACAVRLVVAGDCARLSISDEGPGLDAEAVARGRSDRGSSGLGLDIARQCASASGGSLEIASGLHGGAVVVLNLGLA